MTYHHLDLWYSPSTSKLSTWPCIQPHLLIQSPPHLHLHPHHPLFKMLKILWVLFFLSAWTMYSTVPPKLYSIECNWSCLDLFVYLSVCLSTGWCVSCGCSEPTAWVTSKHCWQRSATVNTEKSILSCTEHANHYSICWGNEFVDSLCATMELLEDKITTVYQ